MENCIEDLKHECETIETSIEIERKKLQSLQMELEEINANDDVRAERYWGKKRERQIKKSVLKVQDLTQECDALMKVITDVEKSNVSMNPQHVRDMTEMLNGFENEIDVLNDEIYKVEEAIRVAKENTVIMEKEFARRLVLQQSEANNSLEAKLLDIKVEENEASDTVENLKTEIKKLKNELVKLRFKVSTVQGMCKNEEKRNGNIIADLEMLDRMDEKMQADFEKMLKRANVGKV